MRRLERSLTRNPAAASLAALLVATAGCGKEAPGVSGTGLRALAVTVGDVINLVGVPSGRCMGVAGGSTADQAALELQDCSGAASQQLRLETAGGYYVLRVVGSDRCLAVSGSSTSAGAAIVQASCSGAASQEWSGTDVGGAYRITSRSSGMAIDAYGAGTASGTKIIQWPENGGTNQQWRVVGASEVTSYTVAIATSGSGTTSPAPGTYTVPAGTTGAVTATPASGYAFTGWSGAATGKANPLTVTVNGNMTLTANFAPSQNDGSIAADCVAYINSLRATEGLSALARWSDAEACADGQARSDSESGRAHGAFGACGEYAQDECPGWGGLTGSGGIVPGCLDMMWAEGSGGGHYDNMASRSYTKVACGFYTTPSGEVWAVQDFK